jgi:hypothetical protein
LKEAEYLIGFFVKKEKNENSWHIEHNGTNISFVRVISGERLVPTFQPVRFEITACSHRP